MKLTVKQKAFADNYIESGNAKQSAIDAGYSVKTAKSIGQENLTKPDLQSYIKAKLAEIESNKIMNAIEALELLTRIARGEELETVVVGSPTGVYETQKEADIKTRMAAAKEILKRYPENDELLNAQIRKTSAEADIKEAEYVNMQNGNDNRLKVDIRMWGEDDQPLSDADGEAGHSVY